MNVGFGSPVPAAPPLTVMDRHLPNVPRQRDRQLPAGVGDTEQRVRERDTLVRAAVVGREERREAVDHRRKALRAPERHDGDRRLSEVRDSVDQLDLLWRQVDVRGVLALAFGEVVAVPAGFAADVQTTTSASRAAATALGMSLGFEGSTPVPAAAVTSASGSSRRIASASETVGWFAWRSPRRRRALAPAPW